MIALTLAFVILFAQRPASAPPQAERDLAQMIEYAFRKAGGPEIAPVPLGADASTRHGVMMDSFRFLVGTAREVAALGKVLAPKAESPVKIVDVTPVAPAVTPPMPPSGVVEVAIQFTVDIEGIPTNLHVLTGPSGFNDAALDAVRQWRFASYTINGEPAYAPTTMRTTVTFRRNDR